MRTVSRHENGRVFGINYVKKFPFIAFTGGRNSVEGKISWYNKPYACFNGEIGKHGIFSLHAWINNEGSWGIYYDILNYWTLGNGFSCYGHYPHCDIRGSFIPRFQKVDSDYRRRFRVFGSKNAKGRS